MSVLRNPYARLAFGMTTCMIMGSNCVIPLVPFMRDIFGVSPAAASLLVTVYSLPGILFSPLHGLLADRYGRRPVILAGLFLFLAGGLACAAAPNFPFLVFCRFIQGVGGAALGVLNVMLIADNFPKNELNGMMGFNGTVLSLSTALYPVLGGFLALLNWRVTFLVPVLALPMLYLAWRTPMAGPGSSTGLGEYLSGAWRVSRSAKNALLFSLTFLTFVMLYGPMITCLPMMARDVFSLGPHTIGSITIASSLGAGLAASQLGRLARRFSQVRIMAMAQLFYLAALVIFPFMPTALSLALPALLFGFGQGMNVATIQAVLLGDTPVAHRGAIMAINGMLLRMGQTCGPLLFGFFIAALGFGPAFHAGAALALLMLGLIVFRLSRY